MAKEAKLRWTTLWKWASESNSH